MRIFRFASLTAAALLVAVGPAGAATVSDNLEVQAYVEASCSVTGALLDFGTYDPIGTNATADLDAQADIAVTCTATHPATITLGEGVNHDGTLRRMGNGTHFLTYALFQDAGRTTEWGSGAGTEVSYVGSGMTENLTVYGRVHGGQNVSSGAYLDTVTVTVTF